MEKNYPVKEIKSAYKSDSQRNLLISLLENETIKNEFFLTGGTALSVFYLGHRISEDLDFFTISDVNLNDLSFWIKFKFSYNVSIKSISEFYLSYEILGIKVDFVIDRLSIDCERKVFKFENDRTLKVDCLENIASNKLCAIVSRFEIRDLIDFYFIFKNFNFNFDEIYELSRRKEKLFDDPPSVAFEIEERIEILEKLNFIPLNMIKPIEINEVIEFFKNLALKIYNF
ncbi:MAG: nucleotidyl transferase AbiEii/AbiGii toxin family protein [candidate division WOR-3 bacterium]